MPSTNPSCYHLSASSIGAFKACPDRFRLAYREGIRSDRDTDSQRVGTYWHAIHEVYANELAKYPKGEFAAAAVWDQMRQEAGIMAVRNLLEESYAKVPSWVTAEDWSLERVILHVSFIGYLWYWQNDPIDFIQSEVAFNLPLHYPRSGMPLPMAEVQRVGKIDHVIKWQGAIGALERKSTTRSIAADSDYWQKSKKDTQVSMYALAFDDLRKSGELKLPEDTTRYGNTLYDVWHKPTIKPKVLTQAETFLFIQNGEYMGEHFRVEAVAPEDAPHNAVVTVDGAQVEVEPGKKGFAIRESVGMFGARLLQDIYERPEFYYARREIARTDAELRDFRGEAYAIYQAQKAYSAAGFWFGNESACRATYACPFIPICYGPGANAVCDGSTTPAGFKRLFKVDLTVNGHAVED